jgi:putative transposase
VMKENGWLHKRRIPHGITEATTEAQEQENILKRDFSAQRPSEKFLTDITEVQCADGKLYVSPVMDCFSGEIVALEMRNNMKKELCIDTVRQLERLYPSLSGAVFHSDRGSQYTSLAFRSELSRCGMIQSLSGTGHCFDNARMESFFATLKKEKIYQIAAYKLPREQVKTIIFRYVFIYYNRLMSFSSLFTSADSAFFCSCRERSMDSCPNCVCPSSTGGASLSAGPSFRRRLSRIRSPSAST